MDSTRSFGLFHYLNDDLKVAVLSFVADAPFESLPENYPRSSLTHKLPLVSRKFRYFSDSNEYWVNAIVRQIRKEPFLWQNALLRIGNENSASSNMRQDADITDQLQLATRAYKAGNYVNYKALYQDVVCRHLRFKGPVFYMQGQIQLGECYSLHFFEPRYRLLIAEVMMNQPATARNGGRVHGEVSFLHANRAPLAPTTPATLVQVLRCQMYSDGRADVLLMPTAYVWLEKVWVRPNSGHLYYAQGLRMGKNVTHSMNRLARQEAMMNVLGQLASDLGSGEMTDTDDESY